MNSSASEHHEKSEVLHDKPLSAWEAAEAECIDMSLLEITLAMSPADRFEQHSRLVRFAFQLRQAMEKRNASAGL